MTPWWSALLCRPCRVCATLLGENCSRGSGLAEEEHHDDPLAAMGGAMSSISARGHPVAIVVLLTALFIFSCLLLMLSYHQLRPITHMALLTASVAFTCLLQESLVQGGDHAFEKEVMSRIGAIYCSVLLFLSCSSVAVGKILALRTSSTPSLWAFSGKRGIGCSLATTGAFKKHPIYLDYNGTTPVYPEVARAMLPYLGEKWGNPSSGHVFGRAGKEGVDKARAQIASALGSFPDEVVFVSCGTESDNWAILGAIRMASSSIKEGKPHVVTSQIEHPAITKLLGAMVSEGEIDVSYVPVSGEGIVSPDDVRSAITPLTVLVTIMHSNNEIGSLQPIREIAAICAERGVLCHTDAAQSVGKVPVKMHEMGVSLLTAVGHKFGAPKGIAVLCVKRNIKADFPPLLYGGGQELGLRSGTECTILIAGIGKAAELVDTELVYTSSHMRAQRDELLSCLLKELGFQKDSVRVLGPREDGLRLPNTLPVIFQNVDAAGLLSSIGSSVAASAGAACHSSEEDKGSSVLSAMGIDAGASKGFVRFSVGRHTSPDEVSRAAKLIAAQVQAQLLSKNALPPASPPRIPGEMGS